jgi:hypothetical protein
VGSVGLTGVPAVEVVLSIKKIITLQCVTLFLCFPQARKIKLAFVHCFSEQFQFFAKIVTIFKRKFIGSFMRNAIFLSKLSEIFQIFPLFAKL